MRSYASAFSLFMIAFILLSGCLRGAGANPAGKGEIPEVKKNCGLCHPSHAGQQMTGLLKKPVSELCLDCHPERAGNREHVVDVVPSMTVAGLPLREGKITCATCHDAHSNQYGKLLRMPQTKLCQACHKK